MDNLNHIFTPDEQYAWTNPAPFGQSYHHGNLPFTTPGAGQTLPADEFAIPVTVTTSQDRPGAGSARATGANEPQMRQRALLWDLYREEIQKLYLVDKMKLEDIRYKMKRKKGFEATCVPRLEDATHLTIS
jgi:hypothetical protein